MATDPAKNRAEIQRRLAAREQAQADAAAGSSWLQHGLDRLAEAERPAADPQLVHLQKDPGHYEDPRKVARQVRAAQAQADSDPYMQAFIDERRRHVPLAPFGVSGYNDRTGTR
jgi:hypothetical protein